MEKKQTIERLKEIYKLTMQTESKLGCALGCHDISILSKEQDEIEKLICDILDLSEEDVYNLGDCMGFYLFDDNFDGEPEPYNYDDLMRDIEEVKKGENLNSLILVNFEGEYDE